jgi:hypothetical protein
MVVNGLKAIRIDKSLYWTVRQFSNLTGYSEPNIRSLIYYGNCIRKLKSFYFGSNKPLIYAEELFEFPFVFSGRPLKEHKNKIKVKRFYLNDEEKLSSREELIER